MIFYLILNNPTNNLLRHFRLVNRFKVDFEFLQNYIESTNKQSLQIRSNEQYEPLDLKGWYHDLSELEGAYVVRQKYIVPEQVIA
jgi:hypothetical protein